MKLSEAIMLGSTIPGEPLNNWSYRTCLCGVAVRAFSSNETANIANREARERWPWLKQLFGGDRFLFGENFVSHLCDLVIEGRITLEQAVDRIREVEPEEKLSEFKAEQELLCAATRP